MAQTGILFLLFLDASLAFKINALSFAQSRIRTLSRSHQQPQRTHSRTPLKDASEFQIGTAEERPTLLIDKDERAAPYSSHIATIRSRNLAGVVNADSNEDGTISVDLGQSPNLVSVTGETGSGKSLLVARLCELITGGKTTLLRSPQSNQEKEDDECDEESQAFVEMIIELGEPHLTMVERSLELLGLDATIQLRPNASDQRMATLALKRVLQSSSKRLKSQCQINGQPVTLKTLRTIASPLVAIVDATAAASALSRPSSRLAIVDTGVESGVRSEAKVAKAKYRSCREYRERLEQELASRVLPPSMSGGVDDETDLKLLRHWVDELDAFEGRIDQFYDTIGTQQLDFGSTVSQAAQVLCSQSWCEDYSYDAKNTSFSSSLYSRLVDFREAIRSLDEQVLAARSACEALSSLSAPDSAATAIERARNLLFDVSGNERDDSPLLASAETTHDHLNQIEAALSKCVRSLEDDQQGLLSILETSRSGVIVSMEEIDTIIADWNTLARKHGIGPYVLPSCHRALRGELDGNVEAREKLPKAYAKEQEALGEFEKACETLTKARSEVAAQLSTAVTTRMPSLGMEHSTFGAALQSNVCGCTDVSAYGVGAALGLDAIDFLLVHEKDDVTTKTPSRGGRVDVVASSGEKARLLLAIECELPGSIGATRGTTQESGFEMSSASGSIPPPVAVIYDEIDAHVGGRAAVAMASMLADQTRPRKGDGARSQVISITHSPSVAAIADMHLVIEKSPSAGNKKHGRVPVRASMVDQQDRRKELARMASGDLAPAEAEAFAAALLREGARQQNM